MPIKQLQKKVNMLYFVTSNKNKIYRAKQNFGPMGIDFETKPFEVPEIQSNNMDEIAIKKAVDAYTILQKPLFVSDDSWFIPALNGFPGAYMKDVNNWFTVDDFLRLMEPHKDRTVIMRETLCFTDGTETKVFSQDNKGVLLKKPRGEGKPSLILASFSKTGKSLGESIAEGLQPIDNITIWKDLGNFYLSRSKTR